MRFATLPMCVPLLLGCSASPALESEAESAVIAAEDPPSRFLVLEGTVSLRDEGEMAVAAKGERSAVARATSGSSAYESGLWCADEAPRCRLKVVAGEMDVFFRRPDGRTDGVHVRVRGRLEARIRAVFPELCRVPGMDSRGGTACVLWKVSATRRAFGNDGVERSDGRDILEDLGLEP